MMIFISLLDLFHIPEVSVLGTDKACNRREKQSLPLTHAPPTHMDGSRSADGPTARTGSEACRDVRACLKERMRNPAMTGYRSARR